MWIAAKVILGLVLGVAIASELSKLGATRSRNARPTVIRYTAPSPWSDAAPIVGAQWISHGTTNWPSGTVELWRRGY